MHYIRLADVPGVANWIFIIYIDMFLQRLKKYTLEFIHNMYIYNSNIYTSLSAFGMNKPNYNYKIQ